MRSRLAASGFLLALASFTIGCASVLSVQKGGFNLIPIDQEWSMRDDMKAQVASKYKLATDASALAYLNELGRRLVAQTELRELPWEFGIVEDDSVNAFNLPGGLVYVNKGLLKEADKLSELTAVLGHEIGHGAARHGTQLMSRSVGVEALTSIVLGKDPSQSKQVLGGLVGSGIILRYGREAEMEADGLGVRYNHAAGFDPQGAVVFFRKLLALRKGSPSRMEQFFSSHPLTEDRIRDVQAAIAQLPPQRAPIEDAAEYHAFRQRLGVD